MPHVLLHVQAALALYLLGLIWVIQVVHYPLFHFVNATHFVEFESAHQSRMSIVAAAPMVAELFLAVGLFWVRPPGVPLWALGVGLALVLAAWGVTFFVSVPYHTTLSEGYDTTAHRALVTTNWLRTAAWTLRGILVLWMLHRAYSAP